MTTFRPFKQRCRDANERADIAAVAMALRLDVDTRERPPTALCPFHGDDGRRNLTFYQEPGSRGATLPRAYCFACKTQATALDLVCKQMDVDIFEGLDWLERYLGIGGGAPAPVPYRPRVRKPPPPRKDKRPALNLAIRRLWDEEGKHARDYLIEGRGLDEAVLRQYQLGYWGTDDSRWSGRFVVPYLESLGSDDPVYTMLGGVLRPVRHLGGGGVLAQSGDGTDSEAAPSGEGAGSEEHRGDGDKERRRDHPPKYLYTSAADREPYLWRIGMARAEEEGLLILCEGELDGLSLLCSLGDSVPVVALGGVGAISAIAGDARLAGLDVLYIADREAEEKAEKVGQVVAANIWKLAQLNANIRLAYPPEISVGGKTDVNDLLLAHGPEGVEDWVLGEVADMLKDGTGRSLI